MVVSKPIYIHILDKKTLSKMFNRKFKNIRGIPWASSIFKNVQIRSNFIFLGSVHRFRFNDDGLCGVHKEK